MCASLLAYRTGHKCHVCGLRGGFQEAAGLSRSCLLDRPIALVIQEEPAVRRALRSLGWYLRLHNESLGLRVEEADGVAILHTEAIVKRPELARQATELSVGALHRILRSLLGMAWKPERVCFSHSAAANLSTHRRVFGTRVEFGCDFDGIVCASRTLDAPLPRSDPALARYARQYLDATFALPDVAMSAKVRQFVGVLLPAGRCSIERVAEQLNVDRRTVHRHLARGGETFSSIVDSVRAELAIRYVESGDRPLADVAERLGFSALSAFSRWFGRRFGRSVSVWRAAKAHGDPRVREPRGRRRQPGAASERQRGPGRR